jgi:hypothetical protein
MPQQWLKVHNISIELSDHLIFTTVIAIHFEPFPNPLPVWVMLEHLASHFKGIGVE